MDDGSYQIYMLEKERQFEAVCRRCGQCCGALDDPCANLVRGDGGAYFCADYNNRLGPQKTVSGGSFNCVPIREHIAKGTLRPGCAYAVGGGI